MLRGPERCCRLLTARAVGGAGRTGEAKPPFRLYTRMKTTTAYGETTWNLSSCSVPLDQEARMIEGSDWRYHERFRRRLRAVAATGW